MTAKAKDIISIIRYIQRSRKSKISLDELKQSSGAEPLRVETIMYEFYLGGTLQPSAYSYWGVPIEYFVPSEITTSINALFMNSKMSQLYSNPSKTTKPHTN